MSAGPPEAADVSLLRAAPHECWSPLQEQQTLLTTEHLSRPRFQFYVCLGILCIYSSLYSL